MINLKFSCLLTHQRPQSTIPVSFKTSGYTKFRMLRDYFHLAVLRKSWSPPEAQETLLSLSEHLLSFKTQSSEVDTQEGKVYTSKWEVRMQSLLIQEHHRFVPKANRIQCTSRSATHNKPSTCHRNTDFYSYRDTHLYISWKRFRMQMCQDRKHWRTPRCLFGIALTMQCPKGCS